MICEDVRSRLSPYIDGELPAAEAEDVAVHLEQCATCRNELAVMQRVNALVQKPLFAEPATGYWRELHERVMSALPMEARKAWLLRVAEGWRVWWSTPPLGFKLAGAVAVIFVAFIVGRLYFSPVREQALSPTLATQPKSESASVVKREDVKREAPSETKAIVTAPARVHKVPPRAASVPQQEIRKAEPEVSSRPSESTTPEQTYAAKLPPTLPMPRADTALAELVLSSQVPRDTTAVVPHPTNLPELQVTMAEQGPPREEEKPSIAARPLRKPMGKTLSTLAPVARYDARGGAPLMSRLDASPEEKYYQTMALAESASSLDERVRIWSAYLNGNPKSKYRDEAVGQLATTLYEMVKENPQEENVTSTIQFFQDNAKVLEKALGKDGFAHRLEELVTLKKQVSQEQK